MSYIIDIAEPAIGIYEKDNQRDKEPPGAKSRGRDPKRLSQILTKSVSDDGHRDHTHAAAGPDTQYNECTVKH